LTRRFMKAYRELIERSLIEHGGTGTA